MITGHFEPFKNMSSTEQHLMLFLAFAMNDAERELTHADFLKN